MSTRKRPASEPPAAPPKRRRRSPEEAREEILLAAERLLRAGDPEHVGLKDIAAAAGVTHGLVAHYFGTYAGVVRAVLARWNKAAAMETFERIVEAREHLDFDALGVFVFELLSDRQRTRLAMWLSFQDDDPRKQKPDGPREGAMLRILVDLLEQSMPSIRERQGKGPVPRRNIEQAVLLTLAAGQGYAFGAERWLRALGREPSPEARDELRRTLWLAVQRMLDDPSPEPNVLSQSQ